MRNRPELEAGPSDDLMEIANLPNELARRPTEGELFTFVLDPWEQRLRSRANARQNHQTSKTRPTA